MRKRLTSETLFCDFYAKDIHSYRDLPRVYNQWCSVVRWEKTTRPFLRSREFLWQEGHTAHASAEEAEARTIQMLNLYADFCEECAGYSCHQADRKPIRRSSAGAEATYTIESLMHDGKALQSGTSHNFGDGLLQRHLTFSSPTKTTQLKVCSPDFLGNDHPSDRRDHHGTRRQQRSGAASEGCAGPDYGGAGTAAEGRRAG